MSKKFLMIIALVLCMALCLCACVSDNVDDTKGTEPSGTTGPSTEPSTDPSTEPTDDGKKTYTIILQDEEGKPIANTMVQLCLESCVPNMTDIKGIATFKLPEADYYASVSVMPEGYEYATGAEKYYFEDGSYTVTIVLKAIAG